MGWKADFSEVWEEGSKMEYSFWSQLHQANTLCESSIFPPSAVLHFNCSKRAAARGVGQHWLTFRWLLEDMMHTRARKQYRLWKSTSKRTNVSLRIYYYEESNHALPLRNLIKPTQQCTINMKQHTFPFPDPVFLNFCRQEIVPELLW